MAQLFELAGKKLKMSVTNMLKDLQGKMKKWGILAENWKI